MKDDGTLIAVIYVVLLVIGVILTATFLVAIVALIVEFFRWVL